MNCSRTIGPITGNGVSIYSRSLLLSNFDSLLTNIICLTPILLHLLSALRAAYFSFASACLIFGGIAGYKKGQDKDMVGVSVPRSIKLMAGKALLAGTTLCASVSSVVAGSVIYYYDIKSIDDFQMRMRAFVPSMMSPVPKAVEKLGLKTKLEGSGNVSDFEVNNLDQTMKEAFGKSDYYAEFKPEDYAHQKVPPTSTPL